MANKRTIILVALVLIVIIGLVSFSCGVLLLPTISIFAPTSTLTSTITSTSTLTPSPLPPIYVTLNVNEFASYTVYWKRELWEDAISGSTYTEDFESDSSEYGELTFPYLTGNGFLLTGESSALLFNDSSLLPSGNLIHFRDWNKGLIFVFPNNAVAGAFGFDYKASETWQLSFVDSTVTLPKGRNRFIGILIHNKFPGNFVLFSTERVQGGISVDNISYVQTTNMTAAPSSTSENVTITAAGGNINIRRGPGADYDPIGYLLDEQSALAIARNEKGTWLYISLPGATEQFGWINAITNLSRTIGDINVLPIKNVDAPVPAYVRNCTGNPMILNPGNIKIDSLLNHPSNMIVVFPGDYKVFDTTTSGPAIGAVIVREGNTIDIITDGLNKTFPCP